MPKKDPRVDAYIAKSGDFAKPILTHLRKLVHTGCRDVEETIKWQFPSFTYKGLLCGMAAFKQHCTFGFWKHSLLFKSTNEEEDAGMGQFGKLTSLSQLPSDKVLLGYIKEAVRLNDEGISVPRPPRSKEKKELVVPHDLVAALKKNKKAQTAFEGFSYSHRKEYVEWITEAKREETRQQRLKTTVEWLTEGKSRNWKYANC